MGALPSWSDFNVAMVGATAALAGLVIVAASVNIREVVKASTITARLAAGIASLLLALTASAVAVVPDLPTYGYAIAVFLAAAGAGAFQVHATAVILRDRAPEARARFLKSALGFLPIACYLAAAAAVLALPALGLALAAIGCLLAIIAAIVVSWVALVEVLR